PTGRIRGGREAARRAAGHLRVDRRAVRRLQGPVPPGRQERRALRADHRRGRGRGPEVRLEAAAYGRTAAFVVARRGRAAVVIGPGAARIGARPRKSGRFTANTPSEEPWTNICRKRNNWNAYASGGARTAGTSLQARRSVPSRSSASSSTAIKIGRASCRERG